MNVIVEPLVIVVSTLVAVSECMSNLNCDGCVVKSLLYIYKEKVVFSNHRFVYKKKAYIITCD